MNSRGETPNYNQHEEIQTTTNGRADFYPFNQPWLDEYYAAKGIVAKE